jgi:S-adenosylhomocysteine hydrolase
MVPEISLLSSLEPTVPPHIEQVESSPQRHITLLTELFNITLTTAPGFPSGIISTGFLAKIICLFLSSPWEAGIVQW